jgi:hypothetical protein
MTASTIYRDFPFRQYPFVSFSECVMKMRRHEEQTAHLQAALLHSSVRAQIRTAQQDSIRILASP